jgi:hypothetical protein
MNTGENYPAYGSGMTWGGPPSHLSRQPGSMSSEGQYPFSHSPPVFHDVDEYGASIGGGGDVADQEEDNEHDGRPESKKKKKGSDSRGSSTKKGSHRRSSGKEASPSSSSSHSHQTPRPATQLRTASRAPKKYACPPPRKPTESAEDVKARAAHNQVEQQYRKRLNAQFEGLLAVLPPPEHADEDDDAGSQGIAGAGGGGSGGGGDGIGEKRISKAEVLDLARQRIKVLERERASLERQRKELAGNVGRLQEEWTRRGGGSFPATGSHRGGF